MDDPEEIPIDNPLSEEDVDDGADGAEGADEEPVTTSSDERQEISSTEIPLDIGDLYIILLDSLPEPFLAVIAEIQDDKALFQGTDEKKKMWEFVVQDERIVRETADYQVLDILRVRKLEEDEEDKEEEAGEEIEFETDELTAKKYSELAIKDDLLNTLIKRLGIYDNPLLIDKAQETIEILLELIEKSKQPETYESMFPRGVIPVVSNQLKFYDEESFNEELQAEAQLLQRQFIGYQDFLQRILKNQTSFESESRGFETEEYEGTFLLDCLQSETCQGLKGTYTYDERKSRHLVWDIDGNRILFPSDKLNIVSALVEPIYSSVWSIDQHTFQRFTVLEKILYEHFWTQLQYRKRGHVSEMMIQNVSEDLLSEPVSEESDNFTFTMIPLSSGTSEQEMKDRLYNFVNANAIVKKLLSEEELCKYLMNFNDVENTLFKYGISISQINEDNFSHLQSLFQKNIRRYQMEYAKSIKGPRSTEELKTTRLPLTKERRVSLSYDYIFRILDADLRNHYLQKFIDIFTRPADKASESKAYLYNKYTNKKILCRHYLYLVNAKNDNSLFSSMKSIYGLPAADGCIYCNCCGEYLCPEDTSLSDGFSDDKPILLREVMREEAEAALLEKQKYLEKEEALAKLIQIIGNSFGVSLADDDTLAILESYELKDNAILAEKRYDLKGVAEYSDVHPGVLSRIQSKKKEEEKEKKDKKKRKALKSEREKIFPAFQKWLRETNKILMIAALVSIHIQTATPAFAFKRGLIFKVIDIQTMSIHKPGLEYIVEKLKKLALDKDPLWDCFPDLINEKEQGVNDIVRQLANTMMYCVGYNNPPMVDRINKYKEFIESEKKRFLKEEWVTFRPLSGNKLVQGITEDVTKNVSENEGLLKRVYGGIPIENVALVRSLEVSRDVSLATLCSIPQLDIIKNASFNRFFKYVISCYGVHPNNVFLIMTVNRMIDTLSVTHGSGDKIEALKKILTKGGWSESTGGFKSLNFKKLREVVIPEILALYGDKNGELKSCYDNATSCSGYIHNSVNNYDLHLLNTYPKRSYSYRPDIVYPYFAFERLQKDKPELVKKIFTVYKRNFLGEIVTEKDELFYDQFLITSASGLDTPKLEKPRFRKIDANAEEFEFIFSQLRERQSLIHNIIYPMRGTFTREDYEAIQSYGIIEHHFLRYLRGFQGVWLSEEEQYVNESLIKIFEVFDPTNFQWSSLDEAKKSALRKRRELMFSECIQYRDEHTEFFIKNLMLSTKVKASQKKRLQKGFFEGAARWTEGNLVKLFDERFLNDPNLKASHCKGYLQEMKTIFQKITNERGVAPCGNYASKTDIPKEWKLTDSINEQFQKFLQRDTTQEHAGEDASLLLHNRFFAVTGKDKYSGFNEYLNTEDSHILKGLYQYVSWLFVDLDLIQGSETVSFFGQEYCDIYLKYLLMRFFGICAHYIQELRNDSSDVAQDANAIFSALETRDETSLDVAIERCSSFVMDLITHILFMHYDPGWLFMNTQKLELSYRLSKQKESEKQFFIDQFDEADADSRRIMIQKQQIGLSNWHKAGSERAEQYVNSAEYEAHTDEQRKLIFKDIDEEVAEKSAMFKALMNEHMSSDTAETHGVDPRTQDISGIELQEQGYYNEHQLSEDHEESMGSVLDEELQQEYNE